jgi:hypothetical protein
MYRKYNGFVSKARVSACMYFLVFIIISDESRYGFLFGGPTMDIQKNWRPLETAQRFSMAHPKSLQPTLAVTL